jgi:hypothetical protein
MAVIVHNDAYRPALKCYGVKPIGDVPKVLQKIRYRVKQRLLNMKLIRLEQDETQKKNCKTQTRRQKQNFLQIYYRNFLFLTFQRKCLQFIVSIELKIFSNYGQDHVVLYSSRLFMMERYPMLFISGPSALVN